MNWFNRCALVAVLMLMSVGSANADLNSKQRVRAFAKLPDWSGLWEQFNVGASGSPDSPAEMKSFLDALYEHPPYNAEWEARYPAGEQTIDGQPDQAICTIGYPRLMTGSPLMFEAIVAPGETTLIFSLRETRHIYTDGRAHPPKDEIFATAWGDSVGHWHGQTLVVDTIATSSAANFSGEPLSGQARYTERIRMVNRDTLEDQVTIVDPVALSHPWQITRQYHRVPNMNRILDEDCAGNDRNPVVNGKFTMTPAAP